MTPRMITVGDVTLSVTDWAKRLGCDGATLYRPDPETCIRQRLDPRWAKGRGLPESRRQPKRFDCGGGDLLTVAEIAARAGVAVQTIYHRLSAGVTGAQLLERDLTTGKPITAEGRTLLQGEWAAEFGVTHQAVSDFVMTHPEASGEQLVAHFRRPDVRRLGGKGRPQKTYQIGRRRLTLREMEARSGVPAYLIGKRIRHGKSPADAMRNERAG